jgi:hypothetical protein
MKILIVLLIVALFQAFDMDKPSQKLYNYERTRVFKKSYNELYSKLNDWLLNNQKNIQTLDKESSIFHFQMKIDDSKIEKYTDYIPANVDDKYHNVVGTIDIIIKPLGIYNEIEILTTYIGLLEKKKTLFRGQYIEADSVKHLTTGELEKEIFDFIDK